MDDGKSVYARITRRGFLKLGFYGGLSVAVSGNVLLGGCGKRDRSRRPSVILITADTLRADHLGCYGYSRNTSPHIDAFARDAILFENCLSHAPDTRLSLASLLSGFLPHETQMTITTALPSKVKTIPEMLQSHGYKTAAVVSNYVLHKGQGWEEGFSVYDDTMDQRELVRGWPERTAGPTTDRAIELLRRFHGDELFLWIHYQDPHGPYTPPEPFSTTFPTVGKAPRILGGNASLSGRGGIPPYQLVDANRDFHHYVSQYDGEIRYLDSHFKRLMDELKKTGLYDDSLILFSSDHGEGMGEHDYYFAHGENLYFHQTHVPLIIRHGKNLAGRRADFVQQIDLAPTILNRLGVESGSPFRGRDLFEDPDTEREIFSEMASPLVEDGTRFSLVFDRFKLIFTPLYRKYELYDLTDDPGEKRDRIDEQNMRKRAENLTARLHRIRKEDRLKIRPDLTNDKPDEEEVRKMKSLGYVR